MKTFENWKRKLIFLNKFREFMAEDKRKQTVIWALEAQYKKVVN